MRNFIAIIKLSDISAMWNYGAVYIHPEMKRELFLTEDYSLVDHPELCDGLFRRVNDYETETEYVMVTYDKSDNEEGDRIEMTDLTAVYALTERVEMVKNRTVENLVVNPPLWPDMIRTKEISMYAAQRRRAVKRMWRLMGLSDAELAECEKTFSESLVSDYAEMVYDVASPDSESPLWLYLAAYERHAYYPKTTMGYFMDMVNVYTAYWLRAVKCNLNSDVEATTEASEVFKGLACEMNRRTYGDIMDFILNDNSSFVNMAGVDFCMVAPLFLYLKSAFSGPEGFGMSVMFEGAPFADSVDSLKKKHGRYFSLAVYLLAMVLGIKGVNEAYYEFENLAVVKRPVRVVHSEADDDPFEAVPKSACLLSLFEDFEAQEDSRAGFPAENYTMDRKVADIKPAYQRKPFVKGCQISSKTFFEYKVMRMCYLKDVSTGNVYGVDCCGGKENNMRDFLNSSENKERVFVKVGKNEMK